MCDLLVEPGAKGLKDCIEMEKKLNFLSFSLYLIILVQIFRDLVVFTKKILIIIPFP